MRDAVGDRRVDDLAFAGLAGMSEGGEHAGDEVERAAAEVAEQVLRERRRLVGVAERVESAGDGDVVDVVSGGVGERAVLAPPGHAPVDEPRVAFQAHVRPEPETLGDTGTEALDEDVRSLDEVEHELDATRRLEVDGDVGAPAEQDVAIGRRDLQGTASRSVDTDDVGAEIGQHHRGERPRSDAGELDDANTGQRAGLGRSVTSRL